MKKIALIFLLLLSQLSAFAAGNMFKDIRQIYLWDVTLSMKGYGGNPDIYDKVLSVMIKDIESIDNDRTEIVVIAFQDTEYCQIWRTLDSENEKQQHRQTDRQTDRHTDRQTHTDTQTDTHRHTDRQTDREQDTIK